MGGSAVDFLVIGGGINGAGIARDAAGRGASVILCEQGDLAGATSSASTKLIHGGLRYLEYYEFRLVREALFERERLLEAAPHIVWPLRFVLPHDAGQRPAWLVRLGLFLYDNLAPRGRLPGTKNVRLDTGPEGAPLKPGFTRGFAYSDCWVQDSRLVVLNARDAAQRGARIMTRTKCVSARRENGLWTCDLLSASGQASRVSAKILVNAAGPWVSKVLTGTAGVNSAKHVRLIKGSHIILPKLYDGDWAYILQNTDRRIVFAIPYENAFTLIGTTDIPYDGDPADVAISGDERDYLLAIVSRYFARPVTAQDIVWTYSGVRPLYDDAAANASAVTRDYVLDVDASEGNAPILSVFGGKITTFRKLAEHALEKLQPFMPGLGAPWTYGAKLPGGDMAGADFGRFLTEFRAKYPWLAPEAALRIARAYGSCAHDMLGGAMRMADLGENFGLGLSQRELNWLYSHEWARTAEDVLWRRSKLGLHLTKDARAAVGAAMARLAEAP